MGREGVCGQFAPGGGARWANIFFGAKTSHQDMVGNISFADLRAPNFDLV